MSTINKKDEIEAKQLRPQSSKAVLSKKFNWLFLRLKGTYSAINPIQKDIPSSLIFEVYPHADVRKLVIVGTKIAENAAEIQKLLDKREKLLKDFRATMIATHESPATSINSSVESKYE
jgi:hypothetical protein